MARRAKRSLSEIKPNEVSLVDTPATGEPFFVVKRLATTNLEIEKKNSEESVMQNDKPVETPVQKGWYEGEYKSSPEEVATAIADEARWLITNSVWLNLDTKDLLAKIATTVNFLLDLAGTTTEATGDEPVQKSSSDTETIFKSAHEKLAKIAGEITTTRIMPKSDIMDVAKMLRTVTGTKEEIPPSPVEKKGEEEVMKSMLESLIEITKGLQKDMTELREKISKNDEMVEAVGATTLTAPAPVEAKPTEPVATETPVAPDAATEPVQKSAEIVELTNIVKGLQEKIALIEKTRATPAGSSVDATKKTTVEKADESSFAGFFGLKR